MSVQQRDATRPSAPEDGIEVIGTFTGAPGPGRSSAEIEQAAEILSAQIDESHRAGLNINRGDVAESIIAYEMLPNQELIPIYIRDAMLTASDRKGYGPNGPDRLEIEDRRFRAVNALHTLLRWQTFAGRVDPRIEEFFSTLSLSVFLDEDPVSAMNSIFHRRNPVGRPQSDPDRNLKIAVEVEKLHRAGDTWDQAYEKVGLDHCLSPGDIRQIFKSQRIRRKARAQIAFEAENRPLGK